MKYKLLRYSLLSLLVMLCGNVFADQVTMKYSGSTTANMVCEGNEAATFDLDATAWSVTADKGAASNSPGLNKAGDFRLYYHADGSNTITVSSLTGATINSISMTFTGESYSNVSVTVNGTNVANVDGTFAINATSFVLGNANTSNTQVRIKEVVINYTSGGTPADTRAETTVTVGEDQNGTVGSTMNLPAAVVVAGETAIDGAAVTWSSSDETIAKVDGTTLQLLAPGTATITARFEGDNNYKPCSDSFKMTVMAAPYTTIGGMLQDITSTKTNIQYNFENLLVRYVSGRYTYVTDGQDNMLFFGSNLGLNAGDIISGNVKGQLYTYNSLPELAVSADDITVTAVSSDNEVLPTVIELNALANNINNYVTIKNVTFVEAGSGKNLFFKVGDERFTVFNQFGLSTEDLVVDKAYDITGFGSIYNNTFQVYPTELKEAAAEEPAGYRDFAVNLTDADIFATDVIKFGVKVAADGTYSATAFDDATANFTVDAVRFNDAQHGWVNCVFTIPVQGPVLLKLGDCQYGAQTGTITDAEGNVTDLTKPAKQCWASNNPDANVVATYYRGLTPTTLKVKYEGYCPFISVMAIDPADLPAEVSKATITFAAGEATGDVPAAIEEEVGAKITLPTNFTLYVEGKTLTGWSDGTNTFAPGAEYTIPEADATLTAVFTANEVSLADRTEPVTVKWNFRRDQGAPAVGWEGKTGLVWVAQATVNGKIIDVALPFSTSPGKFNNKNNTDWVQINNGTKFTVPSCKGATISMEAYSNITTTTIDGQSDYTQGKTISYTIGGSAETVDVVIGDGSYYRYIQVVLPKIEQSQEGGASFDNVAGTVSWQVGNETTATITDEIAGGVQSALWSAGSEMTIAESTYFESTMVNYKPNSSNAGNVEGVMVEYRVKMAPGLTFKPTSVSYDCVKVGTDGATYSWGYVVDETASTITDVDAATTLRNNGSNSATAQLNHTLDMSNAGEGNVFAMRFYISKTANNKNICIGNVKINGIVNGTVQTVTMYSFAATAAPAEGGSVSIYPTGDTFEAGAELTLTATRNFGYKFVNWTDAGGNEVSQEARFKYTVEADASLTANFVAVNTYELVLNVDGTNDYMVTVTPAPTVVDGKNMYEEGTAVELNARQYEGLVTFTNWSDGETASAKTVSMNDNIELTAYYAEADIIAGWDFYLAGNNGRKADFSSEENTAAALSLVKTGTEETAGWLDKSTVAAGGYESFAGAAVNWNTGAENGDIGYYHWQTKLNAADFTDINVQFSMLYNYNGYQTYNVEFSTDGTQWTKVGSITMTGAKSPASFSEKLPAAANNQGELYIRMIADKTSQVDGTASKNDGNALSMFFVTGTPKLVNDGVAPVLVSTVPEKGATGASATGKIVLTFDERIKVADKAKATLGSIELTPVVSGKTLTFEYKGLEYATEYTFLLPANTVGDLTDNYLKDDIALTFTTMTRPSVKKGEYDAIVANADQLAAAIKAANERADKTVRFRIFLMNGTYQLPTGAQKHYKHTNSSTGQVYFDGDQPDPITYINASNISFIGESRDGVVITNTIGSGLEFAGQYGTTSIYDGIGQGDVLQLASSVRGTYFQDVTVKSGIADARGRNLAVQDKGSQTIYKNTVLWGYQDTWTSNNDQGYYYFEGGVVRGRTDFLCGKGDAFFNAVDIQMCMDKGGYIAVPSNSIKYGYVFKSCTIKGENNALDGNYTLGRPWGKGTPIALWIDTKMEIVPSAVGWNEMSGGWPKRFAEYNSTTANGMSIDLSGRKKIFADTHENNPVLTAEEALEAGNLHNMYGDWDPTLLTEQAPAPQNVVIDAKAGKLEWTDSNYALLWAVVKNGKVAGFTTEPTYTVDDASATWAVRAANEMGGLGEATIAVSGSVGIKTVEQPVVEDNAIYNLQGIRVEKAGKGLYIINGKKVIK